MINPIHLRNTIIEPVLKNLNLHSESAVRLLLLTCAVESDMGYYLVQNGGPACGIYQMEPRTVKDIYHNYFRYRPKLAHKINSYKSLRSKAQDQIIGNLFLATALARIHYLRVPEALPMKDNVVGLAKYWKKHYNTYKGKGTVDKAIEKYFQYDIPTG